MGALLQISGGSSKEGRGAVGWILDRLLALRSRNMAEARELQLLETLSLGGRRQLMLVECGSRRFLVGVGAESVQTIVAVAEQTLASVHSKEEATL
jgi:flagellar biogenesis protein FliO